jgi:hypothetical protein
MIKKPFGTCGSMIVGLQQTKKKYIIEIRGGTRYFYSFKMAFGSQGILCEYKNI